MNRLIVLRLEQEGKVAPRAAEIGGQCNSYWEFAFFTEYGREYSRGYETLWIFIVQGDADRDDFAETAVTGFQPGPDFGIDDRPHFLESKYFFVSNTMVDASPRPVPSVSITTRCREFAVLLLKVSEFVLFELLPALRSRYQRELLRQVVTFVSICKDFHQALL